ncbi:MAG: hypothetical protein NTW08_00760 [Gammaproteobacteria bacterium]|nr:hypothetical protein [Gammaproteobacteria bacterium]
MNQLLQRKARLDDLPTIVALLAADDLGQHREIKTQKLDPRYIDAFYRIDTDPNQYLMVVTNPTDIVGTCHLTLMPSHRNYSSAN